MSKIGGHYPLAASATLTARTSARTAVRAAQYIGGPRGPCGVEPNVPNNVNGAAMQNDGTQNNWTTEGHAAITTNTPSDAANPAQGSEATKNSKTRPSRRRPAPVVHTIR